MTYDIQNSSPLVLICSVALEAKAILGTAEAVRPLNVPRLDAYGGRLGGKDIYLVVGGMGKTNAARSLTALIENRDVSGAIGFGVGGAYLDTGLVPGDLVLASSEHYGDEGVETPQGWMSCEGIGIPLMQTGGDPIFNDFRLDSALVDHSRHSLAHAGRNAQVGPFVTVSTCSGTASRGHSLAQRFGAICETMEGAAYAHVAALYDLPFIEIRGISNLVEDRNMAAWQLVRAADAAGEALAILVGSWEMGEAR